ncbi:hypothetical protein DFH29DRAFT_875927 [Suillus ampliporus]|nr:hypothetical protein DFH29DRAFT_875927 [Suillus ampliporus]
MADSDFLHIQEVHSGPGPSVPCKRMLNILKRHMIASSNAWLQPDEQLFQMLAISPLATKYVSHRLPPPQNSSDMEYELGEEEEEYEQHHDDFYDSDNDEAALEGSNPSTHGTLIITHKLSSTCTLTPQTNMSMDNPPQAARTTTRRKPNPARKGFQPSINSELNPCGQDLASQLDLPGDRTQTPPQRQQIQPQPHQHHQPLHHQDGHYLLPPQHYLPPQLNDDEVQAYAGTFALLQGEGSRLLLQPSWGHGSMAQWGTAQLVALAPSHVGENIHGERTQGVIRTKTHVSDTGRQGPNAQLPPTPDIPAATPRPPDAVNASEESTSDVDPPISMCVALTKPMAQKLKELAKDNLRGLVLNIAADTDSAPDQKMCNNMIKSALTSAKIRLVGQVSLADMQHGFNAYAMNTVQLGYGICLPLLSPLDKATHKKERVYALMEGLQYLHSFETNHNGEKVERLLENEVLVNMVIDMLIRGLTDIVEGPLDRLFALCSATIYCVLKSYASGSYTHVSVNSSTFNDAY